jgi:hypothetical protein
VRCILLCSEYCCSAESRFHRIPKIWIAVRFLLICSRQWRLPRMAYNGSGGVSKGSTVTYPHSGRLRSRSVQRPYRYRDAVPTLSLVPLSCSRVIVVSDRLEVFLNPLRPPSFERSAALQLSSIARRSILCSRLPLPCILTNGRLQGQILRSRETWL